MDFDFRNEFRLYVLSNPDQDKILNFYTIKLIKLGQFKKLDSILIFLHQKIGISFERIADCKAALRYYEQAKHIYKQIGYKTPKLVKKLELIKYLINYDDESKYEELLEEIQINYILDDYILEKEYAELEVCQDLAKLVHSLYDILEKFNIEYQYNDYIAPSEWKKNIVEKTLQDYDHVSNKIQKICEEFKISVKNNTDNLREDKNKQKKLLKKLIA